MSYIVVSTRSFVGMLGDAVLSLGHPPLVVAAVVSGVVEGAFQRVTP